MKSKLRVLFYIISIIVLIYNLYPYKKIDPRIEPLYNEYSIYRDTYCPNKTYFKPLQLNIIIDDNLPDDVIARCSTNALTFYKIIYNIKHWNEADDGTRFIVLVHELQHCEFFKPHSDDPRNFMYAYQSYIPKQIVLGQLVDLLQEECK